MALPFTHLVSKPISHATRATAAAFCVVVISGMPRATMSLVVMPSPCALTASRTLRARFSLATRALLTALARGLVSWSCIFLSTATTSALSVQRSIAKAIASARVMPLFLVAIVDHLSAPPWGYLFSRPCSVGMALVRVGRSCTYNSGLCHSHIQRRSECWPTLFRGCAFLLSYHPQSGLFGFQVARVSFVPLADY